MSSEKQLEIRVGLRIAKPAAEVFEAIADPEKMRHYFISESSGRMEEGATVQWQFPEMNTRFPVRVERAVPGESLAFRWSTGEGDGTLVQIQLNPVSENITFVVITEGTKGLNEQNLQWLKSNTEGWANFLACLKAWLEYGINLRKGAFDPSQMPAQEGQPA